MIKPDEIYNLAGQTSVSLSFQQPVETIESIVLGNLNLLEAIRLSNLPIKFYNAGSSEMFGDLTKPANEKTRLSPKSPYGVAKSAAFFQVVNYREAYGINASTGILFNHESPLRKKHFVTAKIVEAVCDIHMKKSAVFKAEVDIGIEANPHMRRLLFNTEEILQHQLFLTNLLIKSSTNEKLDEKDIDEIKQIQSNLQKYLENKTTKP